MAAKKISEDTRCPTSRCTKLRTKWQRITSKQVNPHAWGSGLVLSAQEIVMNDARVMQNKLNMLKHPINSATLKMKFFSLASIPIKCFANEIQNPATGLLNLVPPNPKKPWAAIRCIPLKCLHRPFTSPFTL